MQPGVWDIRSRKYIFCSGGRHRRALDISRQVFHAAPWGASDPETCCNVNFLSLNI
jgi:hypothetical protein